MYGIQSMPNWFYIQKCSKCINTVITTSAFRFTIHHTQMARILRLFANHNTVTFLASIHLLLLLFILLVVCAGISAGSMRLLSPIPNWHFANSWFCCIKRAIYFRINKRKIAKTLQEIILNEMPFQVYVPVIYRLIRKYFKYLQLLFDHHFVIHRGKSASVQGSTQTVVLYFSLAHQCSTPIGWILRQNFCPLEVSNSNKRSISAFAIRFNALSILSTWKKAVKL